MELWKIGDSAIAPNFKLVCKPNDWSKTISKAASQAEAGTLTEAKQLQLEYWTSFSEHLSANASFIRSQKPSPQHWTNFAIGRSEFHMSASVNTQDESVSIALILKGLNAKPHFYLLEQDKEEYESLFGEALDWQEKPDKKESWVRLSADFDPWRKEVWTCLLYTSPSPRDQRGSRMPSSA